MGRTRAKRLRGFGNAIVLPLATAFVESVIDALADAGRSLGVDAVPADSGDTEPPVEDRAPALDAEPEEHAA